MASPLWSDTAHQPQDDQDPALLRHTFVLSLFDKVGQARPATKEGHMNCQHCGDPMCPETVIRLRRTLFGLRESRFQGAYCACCKISIVLGEGDAPAALQAKAVWRPVSGGWWRSLLALSRSGSMARNGQHALRITPHWQARAGGAGLRTAWGAIARLSVPVRSRRFPQNLLLRLSSMRKYV